MNSPLQEPVPIIATHAIKEFDCGVPSLNIYLQNFALQNDKNGSARTYVSTRDNKVVGYYSLAYGSVSHADATPRVFKGLARHPIPIILLARLAVDKVEQGQGLGKGLLRNA